MAVCLCLQNMHTHPNRLTPNLARSWIHKGTHHPSLCYGYSSTKINRHVVEDAKNRQESYQFSKCPFVVFVWLHVRIYIYIIYIYIYMYVFFYIYICQDGGAVGFVDFTKLLFALSSLAQSLKRVRSIPEHFFVILSQRKACAGRFREETAEKRTGPITR